MTVVYIKMERSVEVKSGKVTLLDVASVECLDDRIKARAKNLCIYRFKAEGEKQTVVSILRVIQLLEEDLEREFEDSDILVQSVGEPDVFISWVNTVKKKSVSKWGKVVLVCLVTLCGSAYTIMAYHNDIEIYRLFEGTVRLIMPQDLQLGLCVLELAYSVGLGTGIIVFFNHIGKWKISKEPTPIEVALRKYEKEVDLTQIENADRQKVEVDAE